MARINNLTNFLNDVATVIKQKLGDNTPIPASEFDTKIASIETGGNYQQKSIAISSNGTQTITPDENYDAIDELELTVAVPEKQLQSKTYNFTQNTTIRLLPDTNYDGFDTVTLNINVPPTRQTVKKFTTTDELNADTDKQDGDFATVLDDVPINYTNTSIIFKEWYLPTQVKTDIVYKTILTDDQVFIYDGEADALPENNEYVDVELGPTICSFRIYDGNNTTKATIIYHSEDGKTYDLDASSVPHFRFLRNMKNAGKWNYRLIPFLYYINNSFKGIYKYEKPYTMMDTFDRTKILLGDYANAIITSTDITIPTDPQNYILLETVMEFFSKCEEWSIITPGTEPDASGHIFITLDSTKNIMKGYARVVNRTNYWEFRGITEVAYSSNQSYVCTYSSITEMKTFTYNLTTKEFTVSDWTYDADIGNNQGMLFNDTYIIGDVYSMSYGFDKGHYYFCNYDDDYTKELKLVFPIISVPTYGALLSASDFTATNADVVEGKQFLNPQGVLDTGVMQVLRYPYPYSEYHNYDYEFYTATAKSNVVRDGVSYVLASYQVVPGTKPDTWALTGNRKMKLGIPYSELASKIGLTANKIKAGVTILGITGTYTGE